MLHFIDQIVIPFLNNLYDTVGYIGVAIAMAIESAMIPLPSELILPYAGFLVSDPSQLEPITGKPWAFWIVVVVATIGNTLGSLIAYAIGAWGGRPFLERWGRYILIRPHEIEAAERFFVKWGKPTVFIGRLLPVVRTFISFPAGVARMPIRGEEHELQVVLLVELGRRDRQAAHQGEMRVAQRELAAAEARHAAADDGELLTRPSVGGVGEKCVFDVRHRVSLGPAGVSARRSAEWFDDHDEDDQGQSGEVDQLDPNEAAVVRHCRSDMGPATVTAHSRSTRPRPSASRNDDATPSCPSLRSRSSRELSERQWRFARLLRPSEVEVSCRLIGRPLPRRSRPREG